MVCVFFFFSSRRRHTRFDCDWSSDVCSSDLVKPALLGGFDYTFGDSGWYIGNWNSSVDWLPRNSLETDFYGGYKFKGDRERGGLGKRGDLGGRRIFKKKKQYE